MDTLLSDVYGLSTEVVVFQSNAEVISSMERQYAEQKAKFEKWKIDNR